MLLFLLLPSAASAEGLRVLVLPFEMHAEEDISALRRNVMEAHAR
jgi:hypothetical protein